MDWLKSYGLGFKVDIKYRIREQPLYVFIGQRNPHFGEATCFNWTLVFGNFWNFFNIEIDILFLLQFSFKLIVYFSFFIYFKFKHVENNRFLPSLPLQKRSFVVSIISASPASDSSYRRRERAHLCFCIILFFCWLLRFRLGDRLRLQRSCKGKVVDLRWCHTVNLDLVRKRSDETSSKRWCCWFLGLSPRHVCFLFNRLCVMEVDGNEIRGKEEKCKGLWTTKYFPKVCGCLGMAAMDPVGVS